MMVMEGTKDRDCQEERGEQKSGIREKEEEGRKEGKGKSRSEIKTNDGTRAWEARPRVTRRPVD